MMNHSMPSRPESVPANAVWNPTENEWELGEKDANGKEIGHWIWWGPEGYLVSVCDYDDEGRLHGRFERWHPNGEIAQWANYVHGTTQGMQVWTKPTSGRADKPFPPHLGDDVVRMDVPHDHGRPQPYHFTLYNHKGLNEGVPCDVDGRSIDLGQHLDRVGSETTLHLLTRFFSTTDGNQIQNPDNDSARWIFHGPKGPDWQISLMNGPQSTYVVSAQEVSRAFTLSADFYLANLKTKRPESVAEGAVWNFADQTWESGIMQATHPVGAWKIWDKQGRLRKSMNYTRYGALHGHVEHNYIDGTPEFRATYFKGEQVGKAVHTRCANHPDQGFVEVAHNVWRCETEICDGRKVSKYFFENGVECNQFGVAVKDAYRDSLFLDYTPANFLESGFDAFLATLGINDSEIIDKANTSGWADFWGHEMHPDLQRFLQVMFHNQSPNLASLRFNKHVFTENFETTMRSMILDAQLCRTVLPRTSLHEVFSGTVLLGKSEAEETYVVRSCGAKPRVWAFDPNAMKFTSLFTNSLSHFAYLICSADAFARETISPEAMEHVWNQVTGAWTPWGPWLARAPQLQSGQAMDGKDDLCVMEKASDWIVALLQGHRRLEDIARDISLDEWPTLDATHWEEHLERAKTEVPFGLHTLWRLFFCKKDFQLEEVISACLQSPARILRDAAALLYEIQWGEEVVGKIEDIYELREKFWRLGVLPGSVEEACPDDEGKKAPPSWRKLLSGIQWCHDPVRYWDISVAADQASNDERRQALDQLMGKDYRGYTVGYTLMPLIRLAAKRLGGDVSDVPQHVRTALHREMNPQSVEEGRTQKVWALRVAGEDDSVELEVIVPWCRYDDETIRAAATQAMSKRVPDYEVPQFWGDRLQLNDPRFASAIADSVEQMLVDWVPFAKEAPTPDILDKMMASLARSGDEKAWLRAAAKCLNHSEDVISQAALRVPPPHDASLLDVMAKHEETQTQWARRAAREWLETYPDQGAANKAREL